RALFLELLQPPSEDRDAAPREPAVALELRLAGAARPDAAAEALQVLPHAAHPRQVVLELCELDLELPLGRCRVLREDVQDQLRAVDDTRVQRVLEVTLLRRVEIVVDEEAFRARIAKALFELLELPFADVRPLCRPRPVLDHSADRLDACGPRELAYLGELLVGIDPVSQHGEDEAALGLRRTWDHRGDYGIGRTDARAREHPVRIGQGG